MPTVPIPHPSFSIPLFTQLVHRLRRANARYNLIASHCRHTYRPTHHAKRRAYRAGLRIDTFKARPLSPTSAFVSETRIEREVEVDVSQLTGEPELSPLELEIRFGGGSGVDRDLLFCGGVPGAPRLKPRPLPDDTEEMATESSQGWEQYAEAA